MKGDVKFCRCGANPPLSRSNVHKRLESAPKPVTVLDSGVGDLRDRLATARDHFRQVAPSVQAVGR